MMLTQLRCYYLILLSACLPALGTQGRFADAAHVYTTILHGMLKCIIYRSSQSMMRGPNWYSVKLICLCCLQVPLRIAVGTSVSWRCCSKLREF